MRSIIMNLRTLGFLASLGLLLAAAGCDTSPYCVGGTCGTVLPDGEHPDGEDQGDSHGEVNVEDGDTEGGEGEGGGDGDADVDGDSGTCDGVDLMTDPANCGTCGNRCNLPHAFNDCVDGVCVVDICDVDFWDILPGDEDPLTAGCEYHCIARVIPGGCGADCVPTIDGGECDTTCNHLDDDCNGIDDDCVDLLSDPNNCSTCGLICRFTNAAASCVAGECTMGACDAGYWNEDGLSFNGCEYECGPRDGSPPPAESCNNLDDDCDGDTDEGNPGGGGLCGPSAGTCVQGTETCVDGTLECVGGHPPSAELCNDLDDDCDTVTDNDPTDVGAECGTRTGWCEVGTWACLPGGVRDCDGDIEARAETCNGIDDDCDGIPDNHLTDTFPCDRTGVCVTGTPLCDSGVWVCDGEVPGSAEICNGIDDDCDTVVDNGYDLVNDPFNCGSCGNVCSFPHAVATCTARSCTIATCAADYWNVNGVAADGCEYSCVRVAPDYDTCNGRDDDCDTLTDAADSNFPAPPSLGAPDYFCNTVGACSGVTVTCGLSGGSIRWHCNYPAAVRTDASGTILPETLCNSVDEDCDGSTDENWPGVRHSTADAADACTAGTGICLRTGTYVCATGGATQICSVSAGTAGPTELCNGLDDDCDGATDEFAENYFITGASPGAVRVTGRQDSDGDTAYDDTTRDFYIMRWEASRPDATSASAGSINNLKPCAATGVMPWANVTWTAARDACCRLNSDGICHGTAGATGSRWALCTALDWQMACARHSAGYYEYPYGNTYVTTTCNGNDYDTNATLAGNQDDILATQTMTGCRNPDPGFPPSASWIWDASGNVKEWSATSRVTGGTTYYEIRGGASNNSSLGLTCRFNFTVAAPSFLIPNLGFRCCYYP